MSSIQRTRRLRKSALLRDMIAETRLDKNMFIQPHFVVPGKNQAEPVESMPGIARYSVDLMLKEVEKGLATEVHG